MPTDPGRSNSAVREEEVMDEGRWGWGWRGGHGRQGEVGVVGEARGIAVRCGGLSGERERGRGRKG